MSETEANQPAAVFGGVGGRSVLFLERWSSVKCAESPRFQHLHLPHHFQVSLLTFFVCDSLLAGGS
jgi:hypothetical protein